MIFSLFNHAISQAEAINLLQQIFDPSIPKEMKETLFKRFDKTYRPKIQKWARQFGMPKLEAEELFNEIYLTLGKITLHLTELHPLKLDTYLKGVVKNKVFDYFKALKREPPFELTIEDLSMKPDRNDSVLHQLCKVEQTLILKKALENLALSDKCRQLVKDYYYTPSKITLKKIAEQNKESEEAVRKRKMDCLPKLKAILIKMGFKDVHLLDENFY